MFRVFEDLRGVRKISTSPSISTATLALRIHTQHFGMFGLNTPSAWLNAPSRVPKSTPFSRSAISAFRAEHAERSRVELHHGVSIDLFHTRSTVYGANRVTCAACTTETCRTVQETLGQLDQWLGTAAEYAKAKNFDPNVFATLRARAGSISLARQVRSVATP